MKNLAVFYASILFLLTLNTQASIDCRLWDRGFPDRGRERVEFDCTRILTTNINVNFYTSNILAPSDDLEAMKTDMKEALVKSYNAFSALGTMPKIKAIIYHRPHFDDSSELTTYASAITEFPSRDEACPIIIYPATSTFNRQYAKQLIAHEMFHCFQWKNFKAKVDLGTSQGIGLWWLEGTAQFMSNLVYPTYDMEYSSHFTFYNSTVPLTTQGEGYGNVHFFQSLYNQFGSDAGVIVDFMGAMPANAGASQVAALGGFSQISETFHEFAKSMAIPNLLDSSGREAPLAPAGPAGDLIIGNLGGTFERDIEVTPYTVHNVVLSLTKGYKYTISVDAPEGVSYSIRHYDEDAWREFPMETTLGCDFAESFELVVSAAGTSLNKVAAKLKVESTESERCPCSGTTIDQCMVGDWELDPQSMEDFVRNVIGEEATVDRVEGFENMSVDRSGLAKVNMGWLGVGHGVMSGSPTTVEMTLSGNYDVELFRKERNLLCSNMVRREVLGNMKVTTMGMTLNLPLSSGTPYDARERLDYTCNHREFIISTTIPPGPGGTGRDTPIHIRWRYLRK